MSTRPIDRFKFCDAHRELLDCPLRLPSLAYPRLSVSKLSSSLLPYALFGNVLAVWPTLSK